MDVRPDIQIASMIKAMTEIVLPAVDTENKLAQEQTRLVIATLQLVAKRLPLAYRYDRDELERYVRLARELIAALDADLAPMLLTELETLTTHSADVLERARAEPAEMEAAIFDLRARVGELIAQTRASGDQQAREAVWRLVLVASKQELDRERALVVDIGFEADPADMPAPIEQLLPPVGR